MTKCIILWLWKKKKKNFFGREAFYGRSDVDNQTIYFFWPYFDVNFNSRQILPPMPFIVWYQTWIAQFNNVGPRNPE